MTEERAAHGINWFPGHMSKTRRLITENIKLCDIVCEMLDARIPVSSRNPELDGWVGDKPRVLIMNKSDLADPELNRRWLAWYRDAGCYAMLSNARAKGVTAQFARVCRLAAADILARPAAKGIVSRKVRVMVTGIPNVGKSTFINSIAGRRAAAAQDRPGVTRGKQWVTVAGAAELELLDTPGILWPKIETERQGLLLCATGAIRDRIHDTEYIAQFLIERMNAQYRQVLTGRYGLKDTKGKIGPELLEALARARGFVRRGGVADTERAAEVFLDEYRAGRLGAITWEDIPHADAEDQP